MITYFLLQYRMLNRVLIDFGVPPLIAYIAFPTAFFFLANHIFSKTGFAGYLFILMALWATSRLSEPKRNLFLKNTFNRSKYRTIRLVENLIFGLPFLMVLSYQQDFSLAVILGLFLVFLAFFNFGTTLNFTLPTPFGKNPFEYTEGFRRTYFIFPITYILTFISVSVGNLNLGLFSMILVGMVCLSYYLKPEVKFFVWNFSCTPKSFLFRKIRTCFVYFTLLVFPIVFVLGLFFHEHVATLFVVLLLCYTYLTAIVLGKYSLYPNEMNVPQGILLAVSLMFPPVLLGILPFFYFQSIKNLKPILND